MGELSNCDFISPRERVKASGIIINRVSNGFIINGNDCEMIANTLPEALELTRKEFER